VIILLNLEVFVFKPHINPVGKKKLVAPKCSKTNDLQKALLKRTVSGSLASKWKVTSVKNCGN
jgi:hypothetical protein